MTRRQLVDATYDVAERLNELKVQHGRLSKRRGRGVARGIAAGRALRLRLDEEAAQGREGSAQIALTGEIAQFSISTVCDKRELLWPRRVINFRIPEILRILRNYFSGRSEPRTPPSKAL